jgi:malate dehydrogenase
VRVADVSNVSVWGNHSATQYPDITHAKVKGQPAAEVLDDQAWVEDDFIPTVQKRGAAIIEARGASSAASAANAAIEHVHDWVLGTPEGDWVSMGVPSNGSYGISEGLIVGHPCTCSGGEFTIVEGLEIDDFSRQRIDASVKELSDERQAVVDLGLI